MNNVDYKLACLWLIRESLEDLKLSKAVKCINKSHPELESIGNRSLKLYKRIPDLEQLIRYYCENKGLENNDSEENKQKSKSASVEKVNLNKHEKKRKHKQERKDEDIDSNISNKKNKTENLSDNNDNYESTHWDSNNDESSVSASVQNRFKRIDESKYMDKLSDSRLNNNSYWNMKKYSNHSDNFASKAALELGQVRGKGFRHEKAKKKRCSWKGNGTISTGVSSIQFSDSD
ncbi:hypothetical protein FG379_000934 [Cryptosporidium bovis]|uniref:uncharacterized protein n=1 Tax=Cryptosporidium bovis TaxID=310047 RepID=UPI00351A00F8|nr:hypothetical protein FG379_000934 [Cryptosporidium bovis]